MEEDRKLFEHIQEMDNKIWKKIAKGKEEGMTMIHENATIMRVGAHINPGQIRAFVDRNKTRILAEMSETISRAKVEFPDLALEDICDGIVSDVIFDLEDSLTSGTEITVEHVIAAAKNWK